MEKTLRISISLDSKSHKLLENLRKEENYGNRSEFFRDLVREYLKKKTLKKNVNSVGVIVMIYNHSQRMLEEKLTDFQHSYFKVIYSTTHIHLDREKCLESVVLKGKAKDIKKIFNTLKKEKGVLFSDLILNPLS
ncbi:MAG: nickel-responsive transcriptional regulator NikR [Thermoanaerobaculia bacterium]